MIKFATAFVTGATALTMMTPAAAASIRPPATYSRVVDYSDLNLATRTGDRTLIRRVRHAATKVCGDYPSSSELNDIARFTSCRREAMEGAVRTIHNVAVTQTFNRETGDHLAVG